MRNFSTKRLTAWMLTLVMVIGILPIGTMAQTFEEWKEYMDNYGALNAMMANGTYDAAVDANETEEDSVQTTEESDSTTTYVLAGSDFQPTDGQNTTGVNLLNGILDKIDDVYTTMDGFLFAGDYDYDYTASTAGKNALQNAVQAVYGTDMDEIYIQGNHDTDDLVDGVLTKSGGNDADNYGVFVINEKDYMWYNDDEGTIKNTAANLESYLNAKRNAGYTKPIFVISHLPLHYCMRTQVGGGDGKYANYIFDVLNEAGAAGLNIIFLFGHNHSHGWDDPYGGAAIFLKKGDSINIAQNSTTNYDVETLNFTYMNAGYVSYYRHVNEGAETDLSMTVFAITDTNVTIERYTAEGLHDLKSVGVANTHASTGKSVDGSCNANHGGNETYSPDTKVYKSPQTISLVPSVTKTEGNVSVSAPGITGLDVTLISTEIPAGSNYSAYASYNIEPSGYVAGDTATVTIDVSNLGFDDSRAVKVIDVENSEVIAITNIVDNTVTFTTNHFSEYAIGQAEWVPIPGENKTIFQLTNSLANGKKYVIVNSDDAGNAIAVNLVRSGNNNNQYSVSSTTVKIIDDVEGNYIDVPATTAQWTYNNNGKFQNIAYNNRYLRGDNGNGDSLRVTSSSSENQTTWNYNDYGLYSTLSGTSWYINSAFKMQNNSSSSDRVYIFVEENIVTEGTYAVMVGQKEYTILLNAYESHESVLDMIRDNITVYTDDNIDDDIAETEVRDYNITGTVTPTEASEYDLTVSYRGEELGIITVHVVAVKDIDVSPSTGTVERGSGDSVKTGSKMTVTYDDVNNTTDIIDVTVGMLSGTGLNINKNGTYEGLTVTYAGKTYTGYTLNVVNVSGNDFPEYPNEGAVQVNKTATGIDFQNTGLTQVKLTASGLPAEKGIDMIVMVDTSSSMNYSISSSDTASSPNRRLDHLRTSLINLVDLLKKPNAVNEIPDIRMAITEFNGYFSSGTYSYDEDDVLTNVGSQASNNASGSTLDVYTGNGQFNAGAFEKIEDIAVDIGEVVKTIDVHSGTNYDYAFDMIYQLGEAIKIANGDEQRDLVVLFISDGAPYQYNYFTGKSEDSGWNNWLNGTYESVDDVPTDSDHDYYYNGKGNLHRMAEAIKGDPDTKYDVIRKNDNNITNITEIDGYDNLYEVPGLGATMYTLGLGLYDDKAVTQDTVMNVIKKAASKDKDGNPLNVTANDKETLDKFFSGVAEDVRIAATNARYVDQMGAAYDLQMNPTVNTNADGANGTTVVDTSITVTTYPVYTNSDVGTEVNGYTVTKDDVGKTYGSGTVEEKVSFRVDENGNIIAESNIVADTDGNILNDGVICAKYFFYNTTDETKTIILTDGSEYELPSETFYWNIGTINEKQFELTYTVYLTGSMDGNVPQSDSYSTNTFATLYYDNWLGNSVEQNANSPVMAWGGANVSYAFYLVDESGNPLYADGTQAENFLVAYKVTAPVLYKTINLNNGETVLSAIAKEVLPTGYTLFDEGAVYTVNVASGNGTSSWNITSTKDVQSTYVIGYGGANDYSKDVSVNEQSYDYTHTTVYFAVEWTIGAIPDSVVIDYGLPVDISVLGNDMFGTAGILTGVGSNIPSGITQLNNGVLSGHLNTGSYKAYSSDDPFETDLGYAYVNDSEVRYTPSNMQMSNIDKFIYEVKYTTSANEIQFYYGTITVIPATIIYYEESFLTFYHTNGEQYKNTDIYTDSNLGYWCVDGSVQDKTQSEDRPGEYSLSYIDANNIYGYDPAYDNYTTYSLGSAMKVTVNSSTGGKVTAPYAKFTFTGSGFDIVSLTNNLSGTITVQVEGSDYNKKVSVDTYYGYEYGVIEGETDANGNSVSGWYVDPDSTDSIYQVPVIKITDLPYGEYTVTVTVVYMNILDHNTTVDGYSFWMDAVRIYNPAGENGVNDTTGTIKDAYEKDGELYADIKEIGDQLIDQNKLSVDGETNGIVFIDGKVSTEDITDYSNPGPNNEVYLAPAQAISFKLNAVDKEVPVKEADGTEYIYTYKPVVHIGAKLAYGTSETLKYSVYNSTEPTEGTIAFQTATDMYYELPVTFTGGESGIIILYNDDEGSVISLTNIKTVYEFTGKTVKTENEGTGGETPAADPVAYVDEETLSTAFNFMSMRMAAATVPTFTPETLVYSTSTGLLSGMTTATVITSSDVASLTINGNEAVNASEKYNSFMLQMRYGLTARKLGVDLSDGVYIVWTYTEKADTLTIVASDSEGTAAEAVVLNNDGTEAETSVESIISGVIGSLIDRSGIMDIMQNLADRIFSPESITYKILSSIAGDQTLAVTTSEDVEYLMANGEIVDNYITDTVVDLTTGEESISRVWLVDMAEESVEVAAYNEDGVASEAEVVENN